MSKFNDYLTIEYGKELLAEENLLDILNLLKDHLTKILNESEFDEKKADAYLHVTAIFEQFFHFLESHHIKLADIMGINAFIHDEKIDTINPVSLEKKMNVIIDHNLSGRAVDFKRIADSRFNQFKAWFKSKKKEDLQIIHDAVEFITKTIHDHKAEINSEKSAPKQGMYNHGTVY
jgi:hypothetical protein